MTEEENKPEDETTSEETEGEDTPSAQPNLILDAKTQADRLEKENTRLEKNISKLEELKATEMLSGNADAGQEPPKKKEQTAAEYTKDFLDGKLTK